MIPPTRVQGGHCTGDGEEVSIVRIQKVWESGRAGGQVTGLDGVWGVVKADEVAVVIANGALVVMHHPAGPGLERRF